MKSILVLFITFLFSYLAFSQKESSTYYKDSINRFSIQYPLEWDSTLFNLSKPSKEKNSPDFGALIKPDFKLNGTGGYFTIINTNSFGLDLAGVGRETQASLQSFYPQSKVISSKILTNKNRVSYYLLVIEVVQNGTKRIITQAQFLKKENVTIINFSCLNKGYEKLKLSFSEVIDSFKYLS